MSGAGLGAAVREYNADLQEGLAELRERRRELSGRIREEQAERDRLQGRIVALTRRLLRTSESLAQLLAERSQLDGVIAETEAACSQILEALPADLKQGTGGAGKASEPPNTSKGQQAGEEKHG
ncbi:microtubule nucleation factor SSNA1-like [Indicator indicator]|uniref:microtubule nucleation factor SSNA1-like n=1 Tax=Indicator indicator TaxID=1002788 RepID=UPI0023DF2DA4|nr:microtubule nucleation factor SSNA1-like [Indicator indicator]